MLSLLFVGLTTLPVSVARVAFSDSGNYLMAGSGDGRVAVWDTRSWNVIHKGSFGGEMRAISISKDGEEIAVGVGDTATWWKRAGTGYQKAWDKKINASVETLAFSKDLKSLACGTRTGDILLFQTDDGTLENRLFERGNGIGHVEFSLDNKWLACAGQGWAVFNPYRKTALTSMPLGSMITDEMERQPGALIWKDGNYTHTVAFSPKADLVAGVGHLERADGGIPRRMTIRKAADGALVKSIRSEDSPFSSVQWSNDEKTIAGGNEDGSVWLWQWKTGELSKKPCQVGPINGISLKSSGDWIAVCGQGNEVEVRSLATWEIVKRLKLP